MKMPSSGAVAALLAAVAVLLSVAAAPAVAHDALKRSDPAKNAKVATVEKITLEFTNTVRLPTVVVTGADGTRHQDGKAAVEGAVVTQELDDSLPKGEYTIAFRVVSSDGHPISGEIPFTVTRGPSPSPSPSASASSAVPETSAPATPADVSPTPVAGERSESGGIPGWLWIAVGALAGIGIGVFLSTRSRRT